MNFFGAGLQVKPELWIAHGAWAGGEGRTDYLLGL